LFSGKIYDLDDLTIELIKEYEKSNLSVYLAKNHMYKMLYTGLIAKDNAFIAEVCKTSEYSKLLEMTESIK